MSQDSTDDSIEPWIDRLEYCNYLMVHFVAVCAPFVFGASLYLAYTNWMSGHLDVATPWLAASLAYMYMVTDSFGEIAEVRGLTS